MNNQLHYHCECFIDQNLFIGGDPIGYSCSNNATHELPDGHLVCDGCLAMMHNEPERITLVPEPFGKAYQECAAKMAIDSILKQAADPELLARRERIFNRFRELGRKLARDRNAKIAAAIAGEDL